MPGPVGPVAPDAASAVAAAAELLVAGLEPPHALRLVDLAEPDLGEPGTDTGTDTSPLELINQARARASGPTPQRALFGTPGARPPTPFANLGTVDKKNALRAGALAAGTTLMMLLMSSPALALTRDDGDDPGPGLSVVETLGLYVLAPVAIFALIAGLVWVLDRSKDRDDSTSSNITGKAQAKA